MRILLLEDDFVLGESIEEILIDARYDVDWVRSGEEAADRTFERSYDLYLFDINVPDINGFDLLEQLRAAEDSTPTVFISAMSDLASITKGFTLGADDYIKKPFYPEELLVRVEAKFKSIHSLFTHGIISYNPKTHEVFKENTLLQLGDVQGPFLRTFITNIGRTIPKETLFDFMEHPSDSALRVAINKLKHTTGWDIQNIRAIGYRLEQK